MIDWRKVAQLAHNELANPLDTLGRINRALDMVLDGYDTEKATGKGDCVSVNEKLPMAVAQLVKTQLEVLKYIESHVEVEPVTGCQLVIGEWFNDNRETAISGNSGDRARDDGGDGEQ